MNASVALAQIIIQLLPTIAGDISKLVSWIATVRTAALQTGEWNPEADGAFRAALMATRQDTEYVMHKR